MERDRGNSWFSGVRTRLSKLRTGTKQERGVTLIWVATMMVLLLGASAFAVDLGWIFLNGSRLQRAADSAALAGVVNLPAFTAEARIDAVDASTRNGFPIMLGGPTTLTPTVMADNRYKVDLLTTVDTFFLRALGMGTMQIHKTSTAEYIKPVRLGSPDNQFGGPGENFWAAIQGQYTEKEQGDPFATQCVTTPNSGSTPRCDSGSNNSEYRSWGYYYAIEIGSGSSDLTVELYDPRHVVNDSGQSQSGPGDLSWRPGWTSGRWVTTNYRLLRPDQTPFDPFDNVEQCSESFSRGTNPSDGNAWTTLCSGSTTVTGSLDPGIWLIHIPSPLYEGSTHFGIRATVGGGPLPRVYGLFDMSIYVNITGDEATPWLAEIRPEHEGKTFNLDIFDMGDNVGQAWIEIIEPDGSVSTCSWTSDNGQSASSGNCHVDISNQRFNNDWLYLTIPLDGYTCDPNVALGCWWSIRIHNEGQAHDRTTWRASITGNPLRLVP